MSAQGGLRRQSTLSLGQLRLPSLFNRNGFWLLLAGITIGWSLWQADLFGRDLVNEGGWELVRRFVAAGLQPALSPSFLALTLEAALVTLAYAGAAIFLFIIGASVGGVLASEVWWQTLFRSGQGHWLASRAPWTIVRGLLALPRAVHEVIWGLFFINVLGLDPLTAVLAIAIPYSAIGAKVFSEILDERDRRPVNALINGGASPLAAFLYGLVPPALPDLLSYTFYRFECGIRAAAVLGLIGAGGLGYQILLSLQTLRYEEIWTLIIALVLLSGLSDLWSSAVRDRFGRSRNTAGRDPLINGSLAGAVILIVFSFWYLSPDLSRLFEAATLEQLNYVVDQSWPPALLGVPLSTMIDLSARTLAMSVLAMTLAGILGMVFSFLGARNFASRIGARGGQEGRSVIGYTLLLITRLAFLVGRAVPAPVWALLFLFVLFPGVLPAAFALAMYNWGVAGRLMAESVENMDERPLEALRAQGAPGAHTFLYGALPASMPSAVAYILYRWEVCIRATVIVGLVGAGGLGRLISEQLSSFNYDGVAASLLFLIGLTFLVDLLSAVVRSSMRTVSA